jgi:hypothetical protein
VALVGKISGLVKTKPAAPIEGATGSMESERGQRMWLCYTNPWSIMAFTTLRKPTTLAPIT